MKTQTQTVQTKAQTTAIAPVLPKTAVSAYFYATLLVRCLADEFGGLIAGFYTSAVEYHTREKTRFPRPLHIRFSANPPTLLKPDDAVAFLWKHAKQSIKPGSAIGQRLFDEMMIQTREQSNTSRANAKIAKADAPAKSAKPTVEKTKNKKTPITVDSTAKRIPEQKAIIAPVTLTPEQQTAADICAIIAGKFEGEDDASVQKLCARMQDHGATESEVRALWSAYKTATKPSAPIIAPTVEVKAQMGELKIIAAKAIKPTKARSGKRTGKDSKATGKLATQS